MLTTHPSLPDAVTRYDALIAAPVDWVAPARHSASADYDPHAPLEPIMRDLAGTGPRLNPRRHGAGAWMARLDFWGFNPATPPDTRRVWYVVVREAGRSKVSRSLPSGRWLRVFEDGRTVGRVRPRTDVRDGPLYELPFGDAAALWRDRFLFIRPHVPYLGRVAA